MVKTLWPYKIAEDLVTIHGLNKTIVCSSGISPSGPIHVGNLREVMTTDLVYRALNQRKAKTKFIFSWDDFDRLRNIPEGFPETLNHQIGKPYSLIEDPWGEFKSYAERFKKEFECSLNELGIKPIFISQTTMYKSGAYDELIKKVLIKRENIAKILARNMTQGMTEKQINCYFPLNVYSRFTGKDNALVMRYDGESTLEYFCRDTGKTDTIDFTKERIVKLPWKIDWPMRWRYEGVNFEPGGPDHASPGSSFDVSSQISKEIFKRPPPSFQEYQFIRIKGQSKKMSGSSGRVITPSELLKVYSPELIRFIYSKYLPTSPIDIALDEDVIRVYSEFDSTIKDSGRDFRSLISDLPKEELCRNIPFRKIFGLGESTGYSFEKVEEILKSEGCKFNMKSVKDRLQKVDYWSDNYYPKGRNQLRESPNKTYILTMSEQSREKIARLKKEVLSKRNMGLEETERLIYEIPKRQGMNELERKRAQKSFFKDIYHLLFGSDRGPRLSTFFWAHDDKNKIMGLLENE